MRMKNILGEKSHLFAYLRFVLLLGCIFMPLVLLVLLVLFSAFCAFGPFGACKIFS